MPLIDVPTVHAVTDSRILAEDGFSERAAGVLRALGPAGAIHLRGVETAASRLLELARELAPLQSETGGWVVVNDRVNVALAAGVRGAQLRARSLRLDDARRLSPLLAFGVSVHDVNGAKSAIGADWLFGGAIYDTASHPGRRGGGDAFVRALVGTNARIIAIGGVRPEHVAHLRSLGVWGVAAIRGIWGARDAGAESRRYL